VGPTPMGVIPAKERVKEFKFCSKHLANKGKARLYDFGVTPARTYLACKG